MKHLMTKVIAVICAFAMIVGTITIHNNTASAAVSDLPESGAGVVIQVNDFGAGDILFLAGLDTITGATSYNLYVDGTLWGSVTNGANLELTNFPSGAHTFCVVGVSDGVEIAKSKDVAVTIPNHGAVTTPEVVDGEELLKGTSFTDADVTTGEANDNALWNELGGTYTNNGDGSVSVAVPAYENGDNWATQLKQNQVQLVKDKWYVAKFTVTSDVDKKIQLLVQNNVNWTPIFAEKITAVAAGATEEVKITFQATETTNKVLFGIMMGYVDNTASEAANVTISHVSLTAYNSNPNGDAEVTPTETTTEKPAETTTKEPVETPTELPSETTSTQVETTSTQIETTTITEPTTTAPATPSISEVKAESPNSKTIDVEWSVANEDSNATYIVYLGDKEVAKDIKEKKYTISDLKPGKYQVKVVAVLDGKEISSKTVEVSVNISLIVKKSGKTYKYALGSDSSYTLPKKHKDFVKKYPDLISKGYVFKGFYKNNKKVTKITEDTEVIIKWRTVKTKLKKLKLVKGNVKLFFNKKDWKNIDGFKITYSMNKKFKKKKSKSIFVKTNGKVKKTHIIKKSSKKFKNGGGYYFKIQFYYKNGKKKIYYVGNNKGTLAYRKK